MSFPTVHSNASVDVKGGRFPLFTVDLKFSEAVNADCPAKFIYSAPADNLYGVVMGHFDQSFDLLKGTKMLKR